jgi:hypothetical protein
MGIIRNRLADLHLPRICFRRIAPRIFWFRGLWRKPGQRFAVCGRNSTQALEDRNRIDRCVTASAGIGENLLRRTAGPWVINADMIAPSNHLHVRFAPNRYRDVAARRTVERCQQPSPAPLCPRACRQLSRMIAETKCTAAKKFRASLS